MTISKQTKSDALRLSQEASWACEETVRLIEKLLDELPKRARGPVEDDLGGWTLRVFAAALRHSPNDAHGRWVPFERPREAVQALKRLEKAASRLGPTADALLHQRLKRHVFVDRDRLLEGIKEAIQILESRVSNAPQPPFEQRALAEALACAYADVTGDLPPTSDPYAYSTREHRYHRLVRTVFERAGFEGWAYHAREEARRLKRERDGQK